MAGAKYQGPVRLSRDHRTDSFDCGSADQTAWLRDHAWNAARADTAQVYVATRHSTLEVVGYYALVSASVRREAVSPRIGHGIGRYNVPVILLARLGVDRQEQGTGLGKALVKDAIKRTAAAASIIGARALLIHAESEQARRFYLHLAQFESSPSDPLHLLLLMKDLRRALES